MTTCSGMSCSRESARTSLLATWCALSRTRHDPGSIDQETGLVPRTKAQVGERASCSSGRQIDSSVPYRGMSNDNLMHPYTLTVLPCEKPLGHFHWAIRKNGKLVERSDR